MEYKSEMVSLYKHKNITYMLLNLVILTDNHVRTVLQIPYPSPNLFSHNPFFLFFFFWMQHLKISLKCHSIWSLFFTTYDLKMGKKNGLTCKHDPNWSTPWGRTGTTAIVCMYQQYKESVTSKTKTHISINVISNTLYLDASRKLSRELFQDLKEQQHMDTPMSIRRFIRTQIP